MEMRRFDIWTGRAAALAGIVYVVIASLWPFAASAQDDAKPRGVESPYFFVRSDDPSTDRLPLKSTKVDVKIAGVIAEVIVTQRYRNEGKRPIEARYVFLGGTRAAIHAMTVRIGDRVVKADIREKRAARVIYETAKSEGRTAALLEEHRANVFEMNVANILPGDDVAVELRYTELVVPVDGRYRFVFPTVVGPRYNGAPAAGSGVREAWVSAPFLQAGEATPATFELHVGLDSPIGIRTVTSLSHVLDVRTQPERDTNGSSAHVDVALAKQGTTNDRDFILDYRLAGDAIQSGVLLERGADENFFLAMVEPPRAVASNLIVPREYVFILDISGSMHGYPLDTARTLLRKLIGGLRPTDTFDVLTFSGDNSLLAPRAVPATEGNIARALQVIDRQHGGGSTELVPALKRALALPKDADRSRTMIVITDGYVTVEHETFDLVRRNLGHANLFAFGIGSSVNRMLIEGLAKAGQGEPFVVTQAAEAGAEADRFRKMIDSPVLTGVRVRFEPAGGDFTAYDIEPAAIGDLFAARPIVVFGKWKGTPGGRLIVEGTAATGSYRNTIDLATARTVQADGTPLRRLWARHRIEALTDQDQLDGSQDGAAEITRIGLHYSLLTAYTSFVAVDRVIRNADAPAATVDQPSPLPSGVSDLAVGAEVPATPEPPIVAMLLVAGAVLAGAVLSNVVRRRVPATAG